MCVEYMLSALYAIVRPSVTRQYVENSSRYG